MNVPSSLQPIDVRVFDPCARCHYDLRGVADGAPCSECGLLAERSRQRSEHLYDATPAWLGGVSLGVTLILLAHLCALAWPFLISWVVPWVMAVRWHPQGLIVEYGDRTLMPRSWPVVVLTMNAGFNIAVLLLAIGVWLMTRPQGRPASDVADRWRRVALRVLAVIPFAVLGVGELVPSLLRGAWVTWYYTAFAPYEFWISTLGLTLCGATLFPLVFAQLRGLARRVLHPRLAEHATIVGAGCSATLLLLPLVYVVLDRHARDDNWLARSWVPMAMMTTLGVSFLLFAGWSALNCVRFILAFHKAYRGARGKWAAADRAAAQE